MSKRQKFVTSSSVLTLLMVIPQFLSGTFKYLSIGLIAFLVIPIYWWALKEAIVVREAILLSALPALFTLSVGLFWFLLPTSLIAVVLLYGFYAVGMYLLFLVCNIYAVSLVKTIPLARSARSVGFVFSLFSIFLFANFISALDMNILLASSLVAIFTFLVYILNNWVVVLDLAHYRQIGRYALAGAVVIFEISLILFFWPLTPTIYSLAVAPLSYIMIGLGQMALERRLFMQNVTEYIRVALLIFIGVIFSARWRG
jgi:hypothetical protein